MNVLLQGSAAVGTFFLVHLVLWRLRQPKRGLRGLLVLLVLTLGSFVTFQAALSAGALPWPGARLGAAELIVAVLYCGSVVLSYIVSYPAIEAESPSSLIALSVDRAGDEGLAAEEIADIVTSELFVQTRVRGLLTDGFATQDDGILKITNKGRHYLRFLLLPWRLMKVTTRGG